MALSSGEAELNAQVKAREKVFEFGTQHRVSGWHPDIGPTQMGMLRSESLILWESGQLKHLEVAHGWVQDLVCWMKVEVSIIEGRCNRRDVVTPR